MRPFLAVCLLLILATTASAAPMPWTKFNEPAMLAANRFAVTSLCPVSGRMAEVFIASFKTEAGEMYVMAYEPISNRILFSYSPAGSAIPTEIGLGVVDSKDNNTIPKLLWLPFVLEQHNDICRNLFPQSA